MQVDFAYKGAADERGKAATVPLSVNGTEVARGELPHTIPIQFSLGEGFDVGMDVGSAVDFTYTPPFAFTGGIDKVTVALRDRGCWCDPAGPRRIDAESTHRTADRANRPEAKSVHTETLTRIRRTNAPRGGRGPRPSTDPQRLACAGQPPGNLALTAAGAQ